MVQYLERLEEILNSGDKEVNSWFLLRHNYLPFILCGSYALFSTYIGPAIMKNKKPFKLRKTMIVYNFILVSAYSFSFLKIVWNLLKINKTQFCLASTAILGTPSYAIASGIWIMYMMKYLEFLDTVFFVLRKKGNSITFLHVVHHAILPLIGWILMKREKNGIMIFPAMMNAFVHIIMYTYYGLSAMGPEVRKYLWWKKYLTLLQMVQFILIVLWVTIVASLLGCTYVETSYMITVSASAFFFYLFYDFYTKTFLVEKRNNIGVQRNGMSKEN